MENEIIKKIRHYCSYQERSHQEVREKLHKLGNNSSMAEKILTNLVDEGYLNEERFAIAFAGGKFRMNQWGKQKIRAALKGKGISEYCINKSVAIIPYDDYLAAIDKLINRKLRELNKEKNPRLKMGKVRNYMVQKGFESDIIMERFKELA